MLLASDSEGGAVPVGHPRQDLFLDRDTGLLRRDRLLLQTTPSAQLFIGFGSRAELLRRLSIAEALLKAGFDPGQTRDNDGRWTSDGRGGTNAIAATDPLPTLLVSTAIPMSVVAVEAAGGASIFGGISVMALAGLEALGAAAAAPMAFFGAYFLPLGHSAATSQGTLPDHPDVHYSYDSDTGDFVLSRNGTPIFGGSADADGLIRDPEGKVVGRRVDGSVVIDSDAAADVIGDETNAEAGAVAQAQAATKAEPKLCPDPGPDRPGFKSPRSIAYQIFVNELVNPEMPTPPGLAYYLYDPVERKFVSFDDCSQEFGDMIEAKGPGYGTMLAKNHRSLRAGIDARFLRQATKQVQASGERPVIWVFNDRFAADHARALFALYPHLNKIQVTVATMTTAKGSMLISFMYPTEAYALLGGAA